MALKLIVTLFLSVCIPLTTLTVLQYQNLLYIPTTDTPVTVNPRTVQFSRQLDVSNIHKALQTSKAFYDEYLDFCKKISAKSSKISISKEKDNWSEAVHRCYNNNNINFETRSQQDIDTLKEAFTIHKINTAWAGVTISEGQPIWLSKADKVTQIPIWLIYRSDVISMIPLTLDSQLTTKNSNDTYLFYYKLETNGQLRIMAYPTTTKDTETIHHTICTTNSREFTFTLDLIKMTCARDTRQILRTHNTLTKEFDQIVSPQSFHELQTRDADVDYGETFKANFYWAMGIVRIPDFEKAKKIMLQNSKSIEAIALNIDTIKEAVTLTQQDIVVMQNKLETIQHDILTVYSDLENKINIFSLQSIIQSTLQKLVASIEAALNNIPSPYVFGQGDLNNISAKYRMNNIPLQNDLRKVTADVTIINKTFHFFFQVPIDVSDNYVTIYELKVLPSFYNNSKWVPVTEYKYIGITTVMDEFVLPTDNEFYKCTTTPVCAISTPFVKMDNPNIPCEINTLKYKDFRCPLEQVNDTKPVFITYNNKTYYSVMNETSVHIKCPKLGTNERAYIKGLGVLESKADCPISIAPYTIRSSYIQSREQLEHNELFKIFPNNDTSFIKYIPQPVIEHTTPEPIKLINHTSITDSIKVLFDKTTVRSNLAQVAVLLLTISAPICLCCIFSRHFRLWFKTCCLVTKPSVYWNRVRGYEVPSFIRPKAHQNDTYNIENPQPKTEDVIPTSSVTFTYDQPTNLLTTLWNMQETIGQTRRQVTKEGLGLYPRVDDVSNKQTKNET